MIYLKYVLIVLLIIRRDNIRIKDINISERPRERLKLSGVKSLSNEELLSCILKDGTKDINVKELSLMIINSVTKLQDLRYITLEDLTKIKGIGISKASSVLAAIELGNRINSKVSSIDNIILDNPTTIFEYYKNKIGYNKQESFCCVYLDAKNMVIKDSELFKGTLNRSLVHPREIFREAYILGAVAIICVHNHPSGKVKPSSDDIILTERIKSVGDIMGVKVLDHIIISSDNYYSFIEHGDL